jgi:glutamyl-tRNA synthetase
VMGITHVIRGEDIVANTPKQVCLMRAWGYESIPQYAHVPLIVGADRTPLSKRHGSTAVAQFREQGFLPEVLLNYLAILNWSAGDGQSETFTVEELIERFELSQVTRAPSAFDTQKLLAMNGERIRSLPLEQFVDRAIDFVSQQLWAGDQPSSEQRKMMEAIAPLVQERAKTLAEVPDQVRFLFEKVAPDEKASAQLTEATKPHLVAIRELVSGLDPFEHVSMGEQLLAWADNAGVKRKAAFQPLRAAICGRLVSPPLFESMELLGRDECLNRIDEAIKRI